jgi:hypothetical protein
MWFWLDIVSSFPYFLILQPAVETNESKAHILRMMRMVKFIKLVRLLRIMKLKPMLNKLILYFDISQLA